jgi:hypothetical protein
MLQHTKRKGYMFILTMQMFNAHCSNRINQVYMAAMQKGMLGQERGASDPLLPYNRDTNRYKVIFSFW